MDWIHVLILALIEGITEFLPISSTGHLILLSKALGIIEDSFVQNFNIIIQGGAILAILTLYWRRFFPIQKRFYLLLLTSFLPTGFIGFLLKDLLDSLLSQVSVVAIALILGGILLIWLDKRASRDHISIQELSFKQAFFIGVIQSLALIPGTSRSAAAILGGLWLGMDKKSATEYSFLLGLPTLGAASLYKTIKILPQVTPNQWSSLALGTLLSFLFAVGAIKLLTTIVARYGLYHFGYYRIALGAAVLGASLWGI